MYLELENEALRIFLLCMLFEKIEDIYQKTCSEIMQIVTNLKLSYFVNFDILVPLSGSKLLSRETENIIS